MLQPLADIIKKDRRTLLNWYNNPSVGEKNGYLVDIGYYVTGKKGGQDLKDNEIFTDF